MIPGANGARNQRADDASHTLSAKLISRRDLRRAAGQIVESFERGSNNISCEDQQSDQKIQRRVLIR